MDDRWTLTYRGLDAKETGTREALCTLGNGKLATRGAAEEQSDNGVDYPGTYLAGVYDTLTSEVAGRQVVNDDLVNAPNWLWLTFRPANGAWLDLWTWEVLEYRQSLDMLEGTFCRSFRVRDASGRVTRIESRRLVHIEKTELAAIEWRLVPENWSGRLVIRSGLDGSVVNANVARYRQLANEHLELVGSGTAAPEGLFLTARTAHSGIVIAEAARTRLVGAFHKSQERRVHRDHPQQIAEDIEISVSEGEEIVVEKVAAIFSSRDFGIQEPGTSARLALIRAPDFAELHQSHRRAWKWLWHRHDVEVDTTTEAQAGLQEQRVLRLHIFHVLQTCSPRTVGLDVGVPARGLHGEAYRGHVFWDELFVLPLLLARSPSLARSLILYRYRRLDAARDIAREAGCSGACFPWQSSSDGREATQQLHLNPISGRWDPDHSHLQRHVSAAVAYNVWRYFEATGDRVFLEEFGAELILEIARFWSSLATLDRNRGRYEIHGVMGPDEYHEKYPDAATGGLRNNAYTNVMAVWCLLRALDVLEAIGGDDGRELLERLEIDDAELARWRDITERMLVPFHAGVISQFEGYEELWELDWKSYRERYGDIHRLDRILRAEGLSPDRYQVSKQPDVIMLFYLLTREELAALFQRLGYSFDEDLIRRNLEYYQARTSHGSTLSQVVFTSVVHRQDSAQGCTFFLSALRSDLFDVQGGTTREGVHLGAMAGTVDIVIRHYAGLELARSGVLLCPDLPPRMNRVRFRVEWRNRWVEVEIDAGTIRATVDADDDWEVPLRINGVWYRLGPGQTLEVENVRLAQTRRRPPIGPDMEERVEVDVGRLAAG
jgi:trehalose/maltose hydrolase-like predicted phosphorylase